MDNLSEVATAKALMTEAMTWSVMKWLREKKRVRRTADEANAALDELSLTVKQNWTKELRAAYAELATLPSNGGAARSKGKQALSIDPTTGIIVKKIKESDDEAYRARMDAEETFDKAEKLLSPGLAREGCRKAILAWELQEKAIRKAQALISAK